MVKSENGVARSLNLSFYKQFVDGIYTKRNENVEDISFENLVSFHLNISLTIDLNTKTFLDTNIVLNRDGTVITFVYRKETKLPIPWISKSPKRHKRNTMTENLHRSERISPDFDTEITAIKNKYSNADYSIRFIRSIMYNFNKPPEDDVSVKIPPNLLDETKPFLLIEVPYCEINETASEHFTKKFHQFTNEKYDVAIKWITRKVKSLFKVKDRNFHLSCKI